MDFFDVLQKRRSIRSFDPKKPVSEEQIKTLLEAARLSPSAGNCQDWFFVVAKDQKVKDKLAQASLGQTFIAEAPVVFVCCADLARSRVAYGGRGENLYAVQDVAIATENVWLAATALGLGTVWIGAFSEEAISKVLKLPSHLHPLAILPIGYPVAPPKPTPRRPLGEISKTIL